MEKLIKDLNDLLEGKGCTNIKVTEENHTQIGFYCQQWDFRATYRHDTPQGTITDRVVSIYVLKSNIALIIYDFEGNDWMTVFENTYEWKDDFVTILERKLIDSWPDNDHRPQH